MSWQAILRPSAIFAVIRLRRHLKDEKTESHEHAIRDLQAIFDNTGLDFEQGLVLHGELPVVQSDTTAAVFRAAIELAASSVDAPLASLVRRGRQSLSALGPDIEACFEHAGAFEQNPSDDVLTWWDRIAHMSYSQRDVQRCDLGRQAERLTIELEVARMLAWRVERTPQWKSLDDNGLGYDVLSYSPTAQGATERYIEVKGSNRSPVEFYVTTNEWATACKRGEAYAFHVWQLGTDPRLTELTVAEVAQHIPIDQGRGHWDSVRVQMPD